MTLWLNSLSINEFMVVSLVVGVLVAALLQVAARFFLGSGEADSDSEDDPP